MAKAATVSAGASGDLVIGADQMLEFDGERLTKPADMEAARRMLLRLSGRTHLFIRPSLAARGGGDGVAACGERPPRHAAAGTGGQSAVISRRSAMRALTSVGAYQIEGRGIQLFEKIEGDYFAILGLPLLPLLAFLRAEGAIE